MDFSKYRLKINIRACCLFEQLTGKSYFTIGTYADIIDLIYCSLVANNESLMMTREVFSTLILDKKVKRWIETQYKDITEFQAQLKGLKVKEGEEKGDEEEDNKTMTMTELASTLIVRYGVDPHYVMNEMELWEIEPYFEAIDVQRKNDLITQRFWTYLTILPQIDGKKIHGPEDLVPFDWEKDKKTRQQEELDNNTKAALAFLGGQNKAEKKEE